MPKPFRFSVQAFTPTSPEDWTNTAKAAEDLGYSCLHLADHYLGPGAAADAASHPPQVVAAIPAMMAAADATSTIKIGSRVMCCDYHEPVVLAKSLATIDWLSGGRLEPGYGAGWITSEYDAMGIPMDRPGVRIDRMIEHLELARQYFAGVDALDVQGEHVKVSGMGALPASPQPGGPKIMVGGGSPRACCAPPASSPTSCRSTSTTRPARSVRTASVRAPPTAPCRRSSGSKRAPAIASTTWRSRSAPTSPPCSPMPR